MSVNQTIKDAIGITEQLNAGDLTYFGDTPAGIKLREAWERGDRFIYDSPRVREEGMRTFALSPGEPIPFATVPLWTQRAFDLALSAIEAGWK